MKTSWEVAKKPFNKKKNRYGNIVTCTALRFICDRFFLCLLIAPTKSVYAECIYMTPDAYIYKLHMLYCSKKI